MQSRNTFNGGEVTDEMEVRSDLDIYPRVCRKLENWDLSQIGGIKRRRGMRYVTDALAWDSMLFPFVYSYAAEDSRRFLVEARGGNLRVLNSEGSVVASFSSGADGLPTFNFINGKLRAKCINALMILTSPNNPPMQLKYDNGFTLGLWEFKHMPWKNDHEDQDEAIGVSVRHTGEDYFYDVEGLADTPALGDSFRASYWTEQVEVQGYQASILADVTIAMAVSGSSLIPSLLHHAPWVRSWRRRSKARWSIGQRRTITPPPMVSLTHRTTRTLGTRRRTWTGMLSRRRTIPSLAWPER